MSQRIAVILEEDTQTSWDSMIQSAVDTQDDERPVILIVENDIDDDAMRYALQLSRIYECEFRTTDTRYSEQYVLDKRMRLQKQAAEKAKAKAKAKEAASIQSELTAILRNAGANASSTLAYQKLEQRARVAELNWADLLNAAQIPANEHRAIAQRVLDAVVQLGPESPVAQQTLHEARTENPQIMRHLEDTYDRGCAQWYAKHGAEKHALVLTRLWPGKELHRIDDLEPAASYTVYIDETGTDFSSADTKTGGGKIVALVVPAHVTLPPLDEHFHSVTTPREVLDATLQTVLDAPVGIFGLTLQATGLAGSGDRWASCVLQTMLWILRSIPLPTGPGHVQLHFLVEERGNIRASTDLTLSASQLMQTLASEAPARARQLQIPKIEVIPKQHPILPYADVIAYTWNAGNRASKARLAQSGLRHTCLHETSPEILERAYDVITRAKDPTPEQWRELLNEEESAIPNSPLNRALAELTLRVRKQPALWQSYLHATEEHLQSKGVQHGRLAIELAWLSAAAPENNSLSKRLQLIQRSVQLAQANHSGDGRYAHEQELRQLCEALADEDRRLVCGAQLRLAVMQTNRFAFHQANEELARWSGERQMYLETQQRGRILSSFGRHAAYLGDQDAAQRYFHQALALFERLSNPLLAHDERTHTGVYLAISELDRDGATRQSALALVENVIGPIDEAIPRLATSTDPKDNYLHHLLLRFLADWGSPREIAAYLDLHDTWSTSRDGHPWGLIGLWRGILLYPSHPSRARVQIFEAFKLLTRKPDSATLRFLGLTIGVATRAWFPANSGPSVGTLEDLIQELRVNLPEAHGRLQRLEAALHAPPEHPAALLKEILPFQFR